MTSCVPSVPLLTAQSTDLSTELIGWPQAITVYEKNVGDGSAVLIFYLYKLKEIPPLIYSHISVLGSLATVGGLICTFSVMLSWTRLQSWVETSNPKIFTILWLYMLLSGIFTFYCCTAVYFKLQDQQIIIYYIIM